MSNSDKKYWDFSFHEMAIYDLPAEIDFIYNHRRSKFDDCKFIMKLTDHYRDALREFDWKRFDLHRTFDGDDDEFCAAEWEARVQREDQTVCRACTCGLHDSRQISDSLPCTLLQGHWGKLYNLILALRMKNFHSSFRSISWTKN